MKRLLIKDSLLLVDMDLLFKGKSLCLQHVLVDTGSGSTVISADLAESIGIIPEQNDMIYRISGVGGSEFVFSKMVDLIKIGDMQTKEFFVEVGAMNYGFDLDGIIGLDLLQELKTIINLDELILKSTK